MRLTTISVPEFLSMHLKTVKTRKFHGTDDELSFVGDLLSYRSALRNVSIICSNFLEDAEAQKELLIGENKKIASFLNEYGHAHYNKKSV